jgi:hypothetical protein
MRRQTPPLLLTLVFASVAAGATPTSGPAVARNTSWDSYRIILTRNIFSRDRSLPSTGRTAYSRPASRSGRHYMVLTGVAMQGADRVAFFEDNQTGEATVTWVGQALGNGTVVSVSLDSVEYRSGDLTRTIMVGENLSGPTDSLESASSASGPAEGASEADVGPGEVRGGPADSVLERMRRRRLQETNQ